MRIVSLVPSLSELIWAMGREAELIGCTSYCVHPPHLHRHALVVGGTKDPNLEKIANLAPTHIVVNREENTAEHIAACRGIAPVMETAPVAPGEVPALMTQLGAFLDCSLAAAALAQQLTTDLATFAALRSRAPLAATLAGKRCLYFIWQRPWMVVGKPTYIDGMLALLGFHNAAPASSRYPELSLAALQEARADVLLFSSEPWPFRRRDVERLQKEWPAMPPALWIDGRLMSWYGTATGEALQEMSKLLRQEQSRLVHAFTEHRGLEEV